MRRFFILTAAMLLVAASVSAERKADFPTIEELYGRLQNASVSIEVNRGGLSSFVNGVVVEGDSKAVVVATSLSTVTAGNDKFYLHIEGKDNRVTAKDSAFTYSFVHNLAFIKFDLKNQYGSYASRVLPLGNDPMRTGQEVFIVRAVPGADEPPLIVPTILSTEFSPKGRRVKLYSFSVGLSSDIVPSLIGCPVFDRAGGLVGVINTDMDPQISQLEEAYPNLLLVHPASGLTDGKSKKDKFPETTGIPLSNNFTGYWMPARFGPLTKAWREQHEIPSDVHGVVVTHVYPEGSGMPLRVGDVVTRVAGFDLKNNGNVVSGSWGISMWMAEIFLRVRNNNGGVTLGVYSDGAVSDVTVNLARLENSPAPYQCNKLDVVFVELSQIIRIRNDFPDSFTGILCAGTMSGKMNMAYVRGLFSGTIRQVNGKSFTTMDEFKNLIENTSDRTFRFLVLDFSDYMYKYVTVEANP